MKAFAADAVAAITRPGCSAPPSTGATINPGLVTGTTLGQVTDATTYNSFGEPLTYTASFNGTTQYAVQYAHDLLGRITERTETLGGATHVYDYTYDLAGRLTDVTTDSVPTAHYDYDANSNRIGGFNQLCSSINNVGIDAQDRLSIIDCGLSTASYTYTANGELATKTDASGVTSYSYDVLGNLRTVVLPSGDQIDYVTDGKNRRIGKKLNGTLAQEWLYDGQLRIVAELDGASTVVSRFVYGDKPNAPEYMVRGGVTYRLLSDHLGSPRLVVNTTDGTIAQRMDYDEFGNVLVDTNPGFQPFGFASGLYDRDTKFVRFGARDYDPQTGRWAAKEPTRFDAGDTNLYGYALEDPINITDMNGEAPLYGNYCGPGNTGAPPIDELDAACQVHDDCYGAADLDWKDIVIGPPSSPAACAKQAQCDAALCAAARNFVPTTSKQRAGRAGVMAIFCSPAPTCNPSSGCA